MKNNARSSLSGDLVTRFGALVLVIGLTALAAIWHPAAWLAVITGPLSIIGLWDLVQRKHSLRRNYPLLARIRWLAEDLRLYIQPYFVETDLEGRPFNRDQRAIIYARAKGQLDEHPFGTELDVYSEEYEWLSHSMAPNSKADESWRCPVGSQQCKRPYDAALLNISAMSFGSLSATAIMALNAGAKAGNFYHDTGEGGLSRYHTSAGGDLVWEIGSGYFGCRTKGGDFDPGRFAEQASIDQVKMVEVKLSQGAKPGHGGVLPGSKVTREIAEVRGVEQGQDCISPAAHSAFSTPVELIEWCASLRNMSGGKPVGVKLCVGQPHQLMALAKAMLETGITLDFITVDGAEGGTGAAPIEFSNTVGMPLREGLIMVRNTLVGTGLKDQIKIAAAGKVHSGAGMAMNFGLGADWCNAARAFMFALGCVQTMKCHTDLCPTGVATQDAVRQRGLVVEDKAERVTRYQRETLRALREIVVALGLETPWQITPHLIRERQNPVRSDSMDRFYRFLGHGELLQDAAGTPYARHWDAASADTFLPVS
ncbi:FMN-binding glutamate synthase family protein [Aurantiacibacter zhengii]|uniref:FMN-binding glutamate synthase family protein n=1 Tax=Aurantiacibacter zhengii TaxID=2307003 RepID=A0A418NST4_9SPHN|nr:FMN-binding glutamate synthase family protein [Aurantiacibacter zhengii]RIV86552.1 FMN-binding glutamate synthase family protein [Aurantiacibacter zhengii]